MSHEIETMAYANEVPWHGLGGRVDTDASVEEMLEAAGLNWNVNLYPLQADVEGETVDVPGRFALIRDTDKKVLTVTGRSWKPLQNSDTLGFMRNYVAAGDATLETAGSLRGGKIVWGLARLNHEFEVRKGDKVRGYLLITSPHEVGRAITVRTTTVRVVCANTMAMANHAGNGSTHYRQSHLTAFDEAAAKDAVGNAHEQLAQAERTAKTLDALKLSLSDTVEKVLAPVFCPQALEDEDMMAAIQLPETQPKNLREIINSINNAPGNAEVAGTGWAVMNGVTHWADHVFGHNAATRMYRAWMADNANHKIEVEQKLLELAQ